MAIKRQLIFKNKSDFPGKPKLHTREKCENKP